MLNRIITHRDQKKIEAAHAFLKHSVSEKNGENISKALEMLGDQLNSASANGNLYWKEATIYALILYQGAIFVSQDEQWVINTATQQSIIESIIIKIKNLEKQILNKLSSHAPDPLSWQKDIEHRNQLLQLRKEIKKKIDNTMSDIPEKFSDYLPRSRLLHNIYKQAERAIKKFIVSLIEECIDCLGDAPCEYSIIGFGSLSDSSWTPYSDIEFGILLQEGRDTEKNRQYFRNLTYLLQIKVINLGETPIPFNLFNYSFDHLTGMGFCFDLGGKTPMGRLDDNGELKYELIGEPINIIPYLEDKYFKVDRLLPIELQNCTHITGKYNLTKKYCSLVNNWLKQRDINSRFFYQNRAIELMLGNKYFHGDLKNHALLSNSYLEKKSYDVKKDIYRPLNCLIANLALFYSINLGGTRHKIKNLYSLGVINTLAYNCLKIINGISQELRLKTYYYYKKGKNTCTLLKTTDHEMAFLHDPKIIRYFYAVFTPFYRELKTAFEEGTNLLFGCRHTLFKKLSLENELFQSYYAKYKR